MQTCTPLTWTRETDGHTAVVPGGAYAAVRTPGRRFNLLYSPDGAAGAPAVLMTGTLAAVRAFAETHAAALAAPGDGVSADVTNMAPAAAIGTMPSVNQKTQSKGKAKKARKRGKPVEETADEPAAEEAEAEETADEPADADGDDLTPAERPRNLTRVSAAAGKPVEITDRTRAGVFAWAEAVRDDFEARGKLLMVRGLILTARALLGPDAAPDVVAILKDLYADEYRAEVEEARQMMKGGTKTAKADAEPEAEDRPAKTKVKASAEAEDRPAKTKVSADKTADKAKTTPAKEKNGNGNGSTSKEIGIGRNTAGIPVEGTESEGGRKRIRIFEIPVRGILRWMGQDEWTYDEVESALKKLKLSDLVPTAVRQSHVSSGRHGDEGAFGTVPQLTKDQAKALRALKA